MTALTVHLLEALHGGAERELRDAATVTGPSAELAPSDAAAVQALIVRGAVQVHDELLRSLPNLRVVARAGVGVDNIDLAAAAARNVRVLHVPHALTETVAEHALALALAMQRDVVWTAAETRSGRWAVRDHYRGDSIAGARVAVLGLGSIGQRAASLFRALGADVVTWNRRGDAADTTHLPEALEGAEVVSLHMALTADTRGFIGAAELDGMAPGAALINTARPDVVAREPLLAALESGQLGSYAVDGFEPAPPAADDALLAHPRVLVTPHVAALTQRSFEALCRDTVQGVLDVLGGSEPKGRARFVPPVND